MKPSQAYSVIAILVLAATLVMFAVSSSTAQNMQYGDNQPQSEDAKHMGMSASAVSRGSFRETHSGESPFPTPTPTDLRFVADTGEGLDSGCKFRSEGSIKFTILVTRYVGPTDGDGKLEDPEELVENGVVSKRADLMMPAYDVDYGVPPMPPLQPERDRILFNGEPIGDLGAEAYLTGDNNVWRINKIPIPIELVRFARKTTTGNEPVPGINEIEILIDQANISAGRDVWCTAIDWAALEFKALAPIIMIHGNGENQSWWDTQHFTDQYKEDDIPYDNSISLPEVSVAANAGTLASEIPRVAREFGTKHVHLVCHSKGGLDSRAFLKILQKSPPSLAVMSLTTLSTPHHGSALADYVRDARGADWWNSDDRIRTKLFQYQFLVGAYNDARHDLTTSWVNQDFNVTNLPLPRSFTVDGERTDVKYFSYGADANLDNSTELVFDPDEGLVFKPTISDNEVAGTKYGWIPGIGYGAQILYRTLWDVSWTYQDEDEQGHTVVREMPNTTKQPNDFLVTLTSSKLGQFVHQGDVKRNHATICDAAMGSEVLDLIRSINPVKMD